MKWKSFGLISGMGVFLAGNMVVNLGGFIYHVLMARILGPVDYGILGSLIGLTYFISIPTGSLDLLVVKIIATFPRKNLPGRIKSFVIYLARKLVKWLVGLGVILILLTGPASSFLHLDSWWGVALVWIGVYFLVASVIGLAVLRSLLQFGQIVINQILSVGLKIVLSVVFILVGISSYLGAQLGMTLSALVALLVLIYQSKTIWRARPVEIEPANLQLWSQAVVSLLFTAAFVSMYSLDVILVRHFLPQFEAGIYTSLTTAGKIIFFALSPVAVVLLPIVARKANNPRSARADLLTIAGISGGVGLVIIMIYFSLAQLIVNTLFTSQFDQAVVFLPWFGLAMWGYSLANIFGNFLMALNKTRVIAIAIFAVVLEILAIWIWHGSLWQVVLGLTLVFWTLAVVLFVFCWLSTIEKKKTEIIAKIWK